MRNKSLKHLQKQGREKKEFSSRNIVFIVTGRMFKRYFPFKSLYSQSAGKEIYVSKSSEYI